MNQNMSAKGGSAFGGKKGVIIIVVLVIAGVGAYFLFHKRAQAPADGNAQNQVQSGNSSATSPTPSPAAPNPQSNTGSNFTPPTSQTGGETMAPNVQVTEVDYDGSQFTPNTVNIKAGDYVFFKNKSSSDFWPASNPHPTHTGYPGFDALKPFAPGTEYKFQFTKVGNWGYHDHLNPVAQGKVNVSP